MQQLYSFIPQDNGKSVHVEGILSHNYIFAIFKFYLFVLLSAFLWICKLYLIQKSICDMPKKLMDKNLNWLTLYACKYIHFSWIINYTSIFLQIISNVLKIFSYSFFVTDFKKKDFKMLLLIFNLLHIGLIYFMFQFFWPNTLEKYFLNKSPWKRVYIKF